MKVLLFSESQKALRHSGIVRALKHQKAACEAVGIEVTDDPRDSFDVAHINTYGSKSLRLLKRLLKRNIPVVVHGHSTREDFRESFRCAKAAEPFFWGYLKRMYGKAPLIITPTPHSKKNIEAYGLCPKVVDCSNGIVLDEYLPDSKKVKAFRDHFGLKENEKFVMGVGFPFVRKGFVDFIEVARRFPETKFFWFGEISAFLNSHPAIQAKRHKPENVILPGYVSGELIQGAYQCASCLFFPSYEENEGIVVLEALASSCPLLVRDIDTFVPWLEKDVSCRMGKDNDEFEKEIRRLLEGEDPAILDAGYKVAEARRIEVIGERLKTIYESVLQNKIQ